MSQSERHSNSTSAAPLNGALQAPAEPAVNLRILTVAAALSAICALNSSILGWGVIQSWAFTLAALSLFLLRVLLGRQSELSDQPKSLLSQGAMILPALSVLLVLSVSRELTGLHFVLCTLALLCAFLRSRDIVHVAFGVLLLYFFVHFADEMASYWNALALGVFLAASLRFGYDMASQRTPPQSGELERLSENVEQLHAYFHTHFEKAVRESGGCVLTLSPSGKVIGISGEFDEVVGCEGAQFQNCDLESVVSPDDVGSLRNAVAAANRKESLLIEVSFVAENSTSPRMELTLIPIVTRDEVNEITVIVRDPSRESHLQDKLEDSRRRFDMAARGTNDGIWEWDLRRNTLYYSPRWKSMLGYDEEEIENSLDEWLDRVHPEDRRPLQISLTSLVQGPDERLAAEYRIKHRNGNYLWARCSGLAERDETMAIRIIGSQTDITSFKVTEERLMHDAFHDPLTGLANRTHVQERLARALERTKRNKDFHFALFFLDLDKLKRVNDTFGHDTGDRLLAETGRRLQSCVGPADLVARVGGDEFTILCERVRSGEDASSIAERIGSRLQESFRFPDQLIDVSLSIGIALSESGYERSQDMLRDADSAMYRAKLGGPGGYKIFDAEMKARSLEQRSLEGDLYLALERGEFTLYYQPVVKIETSEIVGFEALLRWRHPKKGLLRPREFAPLARECGLAADLDWWALEEACQQIRVWNRLIPGQERLWVSVNVEPGMIGQPNLVDGLSETLTKTGLDPVCLKLELPETQPDDAEQSRKLHEIKRLGVAMQLDDFGTGNFSLNHLQQLPIESIKINRSLIRRLDDENTVNLVEAMIRLSNSLGVSVIAEGIDSASNAAILRNFKCHYGQGNLYSPAASKSTTERLLVNLYGYRTQATQQDLIAVS